jgi:hypothetical protein
VTLLFETPHIFGAVTADARLMHPSEDRLATPIAMVPRVAESTFSAPPVSSVGDDTVLEEVNFACLIIDKLYFVLYYLSDGFYVNILSPPLSLRMQGHAASVSRSEQGCQGEDGSRGKSEDV